MSTIPETTRQYAAVAFLHEEIKLVTDHIVARARAAYRSNATAQAYRRSAAELDRQAERAARLLFGKACESLRAAGAENWLIADALDAFQSKEDVR